MHIYLCMYSNFNITAEIPPGFSGDTTLYRAVFTVQRARGRFGDVLVNWTIVNATSDVSPTEGVLMFRENDAMATFTVYSTPDNVMATVAQLANVFHY